MKKLERGNGFEWSAIFGCLLFGKIPALGCVAKNWNNKSMHRIIEVLLCQHVNIRYKPHTKRNQSGCLF